MPYVLGSLEEEEKEEKEDEKEEEKEEEKEGKEEYQCKNESGWKLT